MAAFYKSISFKDEGLYTRSILQNFLEKVETAEESLKEDFYKFQRDYLVIKLSKIFQSYKDKNEKKANKLEQHLFSREFLGSFLFQTQKTVEEFVAAFHVNVAKPLGGTVEERARSFLGTGFVIQDERIVDGDLQPLTGLSTERWKRISVLEKNQIEQNGDLLFPLAPRFQQTIFHSKMKELVASEFLFRYLFSSMYKPSNNESKKKKAAIDHVRCLAYEVISTYLTNIRFYLQKIRSFNILHRLADDRPKSVGMKILETSVNKSPIEDMLRLYWDTNETGPQKSKQGPKDKK